MAELKRNEKLDIVNILKDLDKYEPRRRGWTWREKAEDQHMGPFEYHEISKPLKQSVPLPPAKFMENIDPQPMQTYHKRCGFRGRLRERGRHRDSDLQMHR